MVINILYIIIGVLGLLYIYNSSIETFQSYSINQLNNYVQYYGDNLKNKMETNHKFIKKFNETHLGNTVVKADGKQHTASLFDTLTQNLSLLHAMKIFNYVNNYTFKVKNLYEVCYRNTNPCNKDCRAIDSKFCEIYKKTNT
jgi:hypothetical protein